MTSHARDEVRNARLRSTGVDGGSRQRPETIAAAEIAWDVRVRVVSQELAVAFPQKGHQHRLRSCRPLAANWWARKCFRSRTTGLSPERLDAELGGPFDVLLFAFLGTDQNAGRFFSNRLTMLRDGLPPNIGQERGGGGPRSGTAARGGNVTAAVVNKGKNAAVARTIWQELRHRVASFFVVSYPALPRIARFLLSSSVAANSVSHLISFHLVPFCKRVSGFAHKRDN